MSGATLPPPLPAIERALIPAAALRTAISTGLLGAVAVGDRGGTTALEAAARCGLDPYRAGVLLDVLADAGLVERAPTGYTAHEDLDRLGSLMDSTLRELPAAVAGERDGAGPREGIYPKIVGSLGARSHRAAERVAAVLAAPGAHVLDLGAGAAPWSLAILRCEPSARLTAVDRPEVLPATRAAIDAAGAAGRATVVAADLTVDPIPAGADLVLLAHICHLFDQDGARSIVRRAAGSVASGGRLAILDVADDPDRPECRPTLRRYELGLFGRTPTGRVHPLDASRSWCTAAGLGRHQLHHLEGDLPITLLIAEREGFA